MNINQMGLRYNVAGELVNMDKKQLDRAMLNKKSLLQPIRKAAWMRRQKAA